MPAPPRPRRRPRTRADLLVLVKQLLERAGTRGLTKQELITAIGPPLVSPQTVQRVLDQLREQHDGRIRCVGKERRWVLEAPLAMPLDAPDHDDALAAFFASATARPHADASMQQRLDKLEEGVDERARRRLKASELPPRKALTATASLSTLIDSQILRSVLFACRRKTVRLRYASPWPSASAAAKWQTIEPWALHMHDGAIYMRGWSIASGCPVTYSLAFADAVEVLEDSAPRQPIPAEVWGEETHAYGIDRDRPGVAVIRLRGPVARWLSRVVWHPSQKDVWLEPGELLERTIPFRSCRELARRLASVVDGIESIAPDYLFDEVERLVSSFIALSRRRKARKRR